MCRHTAVLATLIFVNITSLAAADEWRPVEGKLMTRWAKDVSLARPWPEYPRPQLARAKWANLNGLWDYAIRPKAEERPAEWDGMILVPFAVESALSGVGRPVSPDQRLWYRRSFPSPLCQEGDRVLLNFGAVDWQCTLWLNGKEIGQHTGGFDPFSIDVTDALNERENELAIAVWDPTDTSFQPRGKQVLKPNSIWYTAVTGIWQTVWLESVPRQHVKSLKIVPDVDRGVITVDVDATGGDRVRISASHPQSCTQAEQAVGQTVELKLDQPQLWSPDAPNLYDLRVELLENGQVVDTVESYCGLRKIEVRKDAAGINRLFLNNEALFQYGPLDQGWWPDGLYTPATDDALKYDIVMTKELGMNMARKHTKYECDRWYYWCDKLGLLVWQDMPSGNSDTSDESKANYRRELRAMIDALHNHPSIVMWVPFNEGWGQHDTPQIVSWLEQYDPTRPINEASGWHDRGSGTISDMHNYPGPGMRPAEQNRALVLGEFGGLGMPIAGHTWQDQANWGYVSYASAEELTDAYTALMRAMRPLIGQGLTAAVYTQTSDVEIEVNGLMTYDRERVKMDLDRIATAARRLYEPPPTVTTLAPTSEVQPQAWRYITVQPQARWMDREFDDSSWSSGNGGFGKEGTPGAAIGTNWTSSDIWLRRSFDLESRPDGGQLALQIHHDEDVDVYLNGRQVSQSRGYLNSYQLVPLDDEATASLKVGWNTLAVYCRQTGGGQFVDVGLVLVSEPQDRQAAIPASDQRSIRAARTN